MSLIFLAIVEDENDKEYITNLYLKYYPLMKKRAYSITGDFGIVDDLIQDAFLKLMPKIPLLRSLDCYKRTSYIVYTLKHVCLDYIRKKARRSKRSFSGLTDDIADHIPDLQAATEENFLHEEEMKTFEQTLFQLSEKDRNLLYFKYIMELSDKEISEIMDIPAQHVRMYIARARQRAFRKLSQGAENRAEDE
ncbi:sigma-70 family RNA polymerase sigma factor [Paenibacillus oralis]|uniref:Sigma-70 family RNA polymerase sigma factor n=1 Tax=Paenibacillus oralis TaxID=2490856 RepID=A0A3P3UC66_9BACL|nr:sigma-70 family RNA polymerase sigma factor [Paenibacillus oralis]RRJ66053.1 sigma-70 family RNA polymerase sigma factor [Paenibacillus oralis]